MLLQVMVFTELTFIPNWGKEMAERLQMKGYLPWGIEVGEDGSINIADWNTYRIVTIEIIHEIFKLYVVLKISRFRNTNNRLTTIFLVYE
jgi:hypothetical protein